MKKVIKKSILILFIISITMLLPAAYAAGESLSSAMDSISAEIFTQNQPPYALSKNIYFDKALMPIPEEYTVYFTSKDSSVMEIHDVPETQEYGFYQYGEIKPDKYKDKSVAVTMTLSDGKQTLQKDFNFTVCSSETKIYYSNSFYYPNYKNKLIQDNIPNFTAGYPVLYEPRLTYDYGWQSLYDTEFNQNTQNGKRFRTFIDEYENNYCLHSERPVAVEEYNYTRYLFNEKPQGRTELSMRLMADETLLPQIYVFHLWATFINENGTLVRKQVLEFQLNRNKDGKHKISATGGSQYIFDVSPQKGEWFKLSIAFDVQNQTYDIYYNDAKLNSDSHNFYTKSDSSLKIKHMNDFQFNSFRSNLGGVLYLDDIVLRTDSYYLSGNSHLLELCDEIALSDIAQEDDGQFLSDAIDSSITFDYSNTKAQSLINNNNLSVEWSSDREDIFTFSANRATVKRPNLDTDAIITAKVKDNATGKFIEKTFNVRVLCDDSTKVINDAYNQLTAERITTQVLSAVTENIQFPTFSGVNIKWETSNSSINEEDGTVTRGENDINVVLSAEISSDTTSFKVKKSFEITILAKGKEVYSADNLYHPDNVNKELSEKSLQYWSNLNQSASNRLTNTLVIDDNNYVMLTERKDANDKDYNFAKYSFKKPIGQKGEVSFRFKIDHETQEQCYLFQLWGKAKNENGETSSVQAAGIKVEYTKTGGCVKSETPEIYMINERLEKNRWYTMKIAFDNVKKVYDVYLNGKKISNAPISYIKNNPNINYERLDFLNMSSFHFNSLRTKSGNSKIYVDDVVAIGSPFVEIATALYDAGNYRTTDATEVISGIADAKMYIYNPTGVQIKGTAVLAGYDDDKLLWVKTDNVTLKSNFNATVLDYKSLNIPFSENVKIKSFFIENDKASPVGENGISANSLVDMKPVTMRDDVTGNEYKVLNLMGEDIMRCYYTMQCTSKDGKKLYFHDGEFNLYEYDIEKETGRFLDRLLNDYTIVTSPLGNVFYVNNNKEIIKMDCTTYEKTVVTTLPNDYCGDYASMIQVNNDESRISIEWTDLKIEPEEDGEKHISRFPVYDCISRQWILDVTYGFDTKQYAPNHKSINPNPDLKNLVLFAHEGDASKDRIWVMDLNDKENPYNAYKQKQYSADETGEVSGHEGWTYDGQNIFFVNSGTKIDGSDDPQKTYDGINRRYSGLVWVGYDGKNRRYINSEKGYCHVGTHPYDKRWAVADTDYNGVDSTITLIDCYTGESYPIVTVHQTGENPGHCHPNFSFDGKTVIFGMYDDKDIISIGWADVSKYIEKAPDVMRYELSDNCTIETAQRNNLGEPNLSTRYVDSHGSVSYYLPPNGTMRVQYRGEETESANTDITLTYMGRYNEPVVLEYLVWETENGTNKLVPRTVEFPMGNSGKWITETINIPNINLENMERLESDFIIKGGTNGHYIQSVSVSINN